MQLNASKISLRFMKRRTHNKKFILNTKHILGVREYSKINSNIFYYLYYIILIILYYLCFFLKIV